MKKLLFILFPVMICVAGCVQPQEIGMLNNRIAILERENNELERKVEKIGAAIDLLAGEKIVDMKSSYAGLKADSELIKDKMGLLTGKLEESEYMLKGRMDAMDRSLGKYDMMIQRIDKVTTSNTDRVIRIEQFMGFEPTDSLDAKLVQEKKDPEKSPQEQLYLLAKKAFDSGDYENSRDAFQKYIKMYAKSKNADNAQFWIGEIYYREKWYEKAILEYQKVIEKYPRGNKVPSALLKQGFAFDNLGEKANSRLILKELIKKYPGTNEAKIAKSKLK